MTKAHDTRTRNLCELTLVRNSYVCHTDLQQDISHVSFSHQIERVLFYASFSCEFLVRVSRESVMGFTDQLGLTDHTTYLLHFKKGK